MKNDKHTSGMLMRELYMWLLVNNSFEIQKTCDKILEDPILSKNNELVKKIKSNLTNKDLPFIKQIFLSF